MKKQPVVFVASMEYSNLGIGYMAALLTQAGFETTVIDIRNTKEEILKILESLDPLIIGFSVIYQYHIDWFIELVSYLRQNGIHCHLNAGGHYASLKYEELFELIPSLDSIIRFEGEYTLPELVQCIYSGKDWRKIKSLAFKRKNRIVANPLRSLEKDIDRFPFPFRLPLTEYAFNKKFATILAGRGCIHNCTFCNQKEFYRQSGGPVKRIRRPQMVVKEMEYLFNEKECTIFLVDDDDFPLKTNRGSEWVLKFCNELKHNGLDKKIMWKINCRPDDVNEEIFTIMKSTGLFMVFLGIEDGTDIGLKRLNKEMTVTRCLEGLNTIRKLEIDFDYGFLLFQPLTTFRSLNENLEFLRQICGDGYTPATYIKIMPYYETQVEKELKKEGRIKGIPGFFDYDFLEESMNRYYEFIKYYFNEWLRHPDGLVNISKWARNYFAVYSRFFDPEPQITLLHNKVRKIISESNLFFLDTMKELSGFFESGRYKKSGENILESYKESIGLKHEDYKGQINYAMTELLLLAQDRQYVS
jgi:radical SAM superfamily enzyme YgiQ (UPF0313 family)